MTATSTRQGLWFEPRPVARKPKRKAKPRDSQKRRLYAAERGIDKFAQRFETLEECQAYLLRVVSTRKFQGRWGRCGAGVLPKHHGSATAQRLRVVGSDQRVGVIRLPKWAYRSDVVLHELGHVLTPSDPGHGRDYAACYLRLVAMFLGREAEVYLREGYRREKVRYCKRRKVSPVMRAAMAARFLELRARGFAAKPGGSGA